jgi:hypothetical protein
MDQSTLETAESMREVVRESSVVDEQTGASPLWHDLPAETQKGIEKALRSLAKQRGVEFLSKGGRRRQAQKYVQTLHERGRKVIRGELDPDYLQINGARRKRQFVKVDFTVLSRKVSKADTAAPVMPAPSPSFCCLRLRRQQLLVISLNCESLLSLAPPPLPTRTFFRTAHLHVSPEGIPLVLPHSLLLRIASMSLDSPLLLRLPCSPFSSVCTAV